MRARPAALVLLVISAVLLTGAAPGCGGGEPQPSATAEFLRKANAACRRARAGLDREVTEFLAPRRGTRPHDELYADLAHKVLLPVIENETAAVRVLHPLRGVAGRISELLFREESDLTRVVFMKRVHSIAAVRREFAGSAKQLRAYGLPACANGP